MEKNFQEVIKIIFHWKFTGIWNLFKEIETQNTDISNEHIGSKFS